MKTTRHLIACICFIVLIIPFSAHADDTAVYDIGQDVKPNVLIIFDNSISMGYDLPYDDDIIPPYAGSYTPDTIYERSCTRWNWSHTYCYEYSWSVSSMTLATFEAGDTDDNGIYDSNSGIRKGNRLNYDNLADPGRRLDIAQEATKQIIDDTYEFVRLGILLLHGDVHWDTLPGYHKDNTVLDPTNGGSPIQEWDDDGGATDKDILRAYVDATNASGATPLAVRLINAAQYFKHEDSATCGNFGTAGGFADPITPDTWCRKNYVIIVTDGRPTYEGDTTSPADDDAEEFDYIESFLPDRGGTIKWNYDYDASTNPNDWDPWGDSSGNRYTGFDCGGGSDYLDDVAKYLYDTDLRPEPEIPGKQNITTFTIGFTVADDLLEDTAENGHGTYQTAYSAAALEQALREAMGIIIDRAQTFTAPVVPVQRTTSGDKMYISLFTPRSTENFWPGYLIKLKIGSNGELTGFTDGYAGSIEAQVTDSNGALDEDLLRSDRAPYPYWDAQHELMQRTTDRHIYTYLGTSYDLDDASNAFNTTNIDAAMLGNPTEGSNPVADLINYIHGKDAYDEDGDSVVDEKRGEILGDILHSRPQIIDYDPSNTTNPQRVIYVGTNDGMLHAFADTDGSEKWAFIPPDLLPKLKDIVEGTGHQYYVDSSPQSYILDGNGDGDLLDVGVDQAIIVFGERRGGTSYCALDVSDPDDPQFLWRIDDTLTDYTGLGESWSVPAIGKVKVGGTVKNVAIVGGGYSSDNSTGCALYVIDIANGNRLKHFTSTDHANLTYSIPSTVLAVDTTFDGYINRVYVGDLGGQMWRFGNQDPAVSEDGEINNWTPRRLFASGLPSPKIFYPPDMVIEPGYTYLYFGTGDRTDPMSMTETNRFYAVKDKDESDTDFQNRVGVLTESHLVDVTADLIQEGTAEEAAGTHTALAAGDGWYIDMENTGEKVLAPPTVLYGMVLFTTFTPVDTVANPCSYGGDARLYVVDYLTATSVIDWDADTDLDKSDRSLHIGQGIPTEVVITITDTGAVRGYVGAGGGIVYWDFTGNSPGFSIDAWREEF